MYRSLMFLACLVTGVSANATTANMADAVASATRSIVRHQVATQMVGFKVGDTNNYNLKIASFAGTMVMKIMSIDDKGILIAQNVDLGRLGKQESTILINATTGEIIEITVNGQKQTPPDPNDTEIISQERATITVPAGTFACIAVKTHTRSTNTDAQQWIDGTAKVPIGGMLKMVTKAQGLPVSAELTSFSLGT